MGIISNCRGDLKRHSISGETTRRLMELDHSMKEAATDKWGEDKL